MQDLKLCIFLPFRIKEYNMWHNLNIQNNMKNIMPISKMPHMVSDSVTRNNSLNCRSHYDIANYSFCNRIANLWNSSPSEIVTAQILNSSKHTLDKLWLQLT